MKKKFYSLIMFISGVMVLLGSLKGFSPSTDKINSKSIKENNSPKYSISETKEQLTGVVDKNNQVRVDVSSWIRTLKLSQEEATAITNVALSDQAIFIGYDDKNKTDVVSKEQVIRITCLAAKIKNNDRFAKILSELRARTFNTQGRVNAYHLFSNKRDRSSIPREEILSSCHKYYSEVIPVLTQLDRVSKVE